MFTGLLVAGLLPGCATPGRSVTQTLTVETPGCETARCELSNDQGRWTLERTPGSVSVVSSKQPLSVVCSVAAGPEGRTGAYATLPPVSTRGAVVGGTIGAGVGAAVGVPAMAFIPPLGVILILGGAAAGAAAGQTAESQQRALHYPDHISVPMACAPIATDPAPAPRFGLVVRGLLPTEAPGGGALVTAVSAGGPAAAAGLQVGDVVQAVDGQLLADAAALESALNALVPDATTRLQVRRGDGTLVLVLRAPAGHR